VHEPDCVRVILGICHDQEYVDRLQLYMIPAGSRHSRKVTLFTCTATHYRFCSLCLPIVAWPSRFRDEPLSGTNYAPAFTKEYTGQIPYHDSDLALMLKDEEKTMEDTNSSAKMSEDMQQKYHWAIQ
jgi:hypothetical protein